MKPLNNPAAKLAAAPEQALAKKEKRLSDNEIDQLYTIAYTLYQREEYNEAYEVFYSLAEVRPDSQRIQKALGLCLLKMRELHKALFPLTLAITIDPKDAVCYLGLGECYAQLEAAAEAKYAFEAAERYAKAASQSALVQRAQIWLNILSANEKPEIH